MRFLFYKTLFLRLVPVHPPQPRQAISSLLTRFSSSNVIPISSSFHKRFLYDEESSEVRVFVWWDFENCHLPVGANVFKVAQAITSALRINGIRGPVTISAFGDVSQLSRTNQEALSASGINLTHVPQGRKNSADRSLIADLMHWVSINPPPAHLFLISSDRDFASVLHRLRMRNYNVLLACKQEATSSVLCSAASIMWDWNDLVRGINSTGKFFNQPPDGPYGSWYGHYNSPLLDPFATKQQSCTSVKIAELLESDSLKVCCGIPDKVVKEIGFVLSLYPEGVCITDLRELLKKRILLGTNFYGHKSFLRFLLSMPKILKVVPKGSGVFRIHACNQELDNKGSLLKLSNENPQVVCLEKVEENDEDVKENSQASLLALTAGDNVSLYKENDGFFKKLKSRFGSADVASSTSREVSNRNSASPGLLTRVLKRCKLFWGRNTELSNAAATENGSGLNQPPVLSGLKSVKSQQGEADDEKKFNNIGIGKKPVVRSRSKVIADCHKLVKKITEENPRGYNMGQFKMEFLANFGYHLDYTTLGYSKLRTLIEMMPEARIESGHIVPSSTPAPYESDSTFQELGPVNSESGKDKVASLKQSSGEKMRKAEKGDDTMKDILKMMGSSKDVKDFDEDKLVDGILISLGKKHSSKSRIQE